MVVGAVSEQTVGASPRPAAHTGNGRDGVEQRDQLGDVVAVAARDREGERDPGRIDEMVLGTGAAAVDWARARFLFRLHLTGVGDRARPPKLAGSPQPSKQKRVQLLPHTRPLPLI